MKNNTLGMRTPIKRCSHGHSSKRVFRKKDLVKEYQEILKSLEGKQKRNQEMEYTKEEKIIYLTGQIKSLQHFNRDLMDILNDQVQLIRRTENRLKTKFKYRDKIIHDIERESEEGFNEEEQTSD